jgi:methylase of polypeptide subunit release factors
MGPLVFEPYAKYVAKQVAALRPGRILETAAGTGIVTRAVSEAVPEATIVAIDINPAVVEFAAQVEQALQTWGGTQAPMSAHIAIAVP